MNLSARTIHRGPLVDRPRHRPVDLIDARPIDAPWAFTKAYVMPKLATVLHLVLTDRGHRVLKRGRCEACGLHRPKRGGWSYPCHKAR